MYKKSDPSRSGGQAKILEKAIPAVRNMLRNNCDSLELVDAHMSSAQQRGSREPSGAAKICQEFPTSDEWYPKTKVHEKSCWLTKSVAQHVEGSKLDLHRARKTNSNAQKRSGGKEPPRAGYRGAQVASALLHHGQVRFPNLRGVVHNGMVQCELHFGDQVVDALHLLFGDEAFLVGEVSPETHAGGDGVAMEHAGGQLIAWAPRVAVGMGAALVGLPQVAVLGADIALHGLAH